MRLRAAASLATSDAFSNCATPPRICLIKTAVGVSSKNALGAINLRLQKAPSCFLHDEIAREPIRRLDRNRSHAIACDALEHCGEAWTIANRVCAAHGRVIEFSNYLNGLCVRIGFNGRALSRLTVAVNIGRA